MVRFLRNLVASWKWSYLADSYQELTEAQQTIFKLEINLKALLEENALLRARQRMQQLPEAWGKSPLTNNTFGNSEIQQYYDGGLRIE